MVIAPFVSIHIYWDQKLAEIIYEVEEPILKDDDKEDLLRIESAMREIVNINMLSEDQSKEGLLDYIDKTARLIISELGLNIEEESYKKMYYYLYRNFIGLNEIEPMMRDYYIEDLECNGMGDPIES